MHVSRMFASAGSNDIEPSRTFAITLSTACVRLTTESKPSIPPALLIVWKPRKSRLMVSASTEDSIATNPCSRSRRISSDSLTNIW